MVLLVGTVSAIQFEGEIPTNIGDSWFDRLKSSINYFFHKQEMFTVYGRELSCSIYPDRTFNFVKDEKYYFSEETRCGDDDFFVNYYRGERGFDQYLKEIYYYQSENSAYITDGDGQGSIYAMPYVTCDAGMYWDEKCYIEVYCCVDGVCTKDSECRSDENCNKATASISNLFPYFGVCEQKEVTYHETKYYQCVNGQETYLGVAKKGDLNWCPDKDENNYILPSGGSSGVCYESENKPIECTTPQKTCWRIQNDICDIIDIFTTSCEDSGYYSSKSVCETNLLTGCPSHQTEYQCNNDPNCEWEEGETWGVHGKCVVKVSVDENGVGIGKAKTITWNEFYSMEDKKVLGSTCTSSFECSAKKDYDVSCLIDDNTKERIFDANIQQCEDKSPGGLVGLIPDIFTQILVGKSFCEFDQGIEVWFSNIFGKKKVGLCIAESTTWYGGLWETALKTVGGMGLPAQYVMIITIMILITLIGMMVRMIQ